MGGVLYLVNLMRYLGLPQRYESGWRLASGVGAWGTLDALARVLCAERYDGLKDDPIWTPWRSWMGESQTNPSGGACRVPVRDAGRFLKPRRIG